MRETQRYPALAKKFNLKMRTDYIETDYVDGTYNESGEKVLRPLNEAEKLFLNRYYEEEVNANFMHDGKLKYLYREAKVIEGMESPSDEDIDRWAKLKADYFIRQDEVLLNTHPDDHKRCYGLNNSRNRCLYNRAKASMRLSFINDGTHNESKEQITVCKESNKIILEDKIEQDKKRVILRKKRTSLLFGDKK